jgi:hypothetical protein
MSSLVHRETERSKKNVCSYLLEIIASLAGDRFFDLALAGSG